MRWGLLSTARINDAFLAGVRESGRDEVLAVASRDGDRAREWARARSIPRAHTGYEALLGDPEVDAVYISLPNHLHLDWSERALQAGKHVLCEKPLGGDPDAVEAIFDLAAQRGLAFAEAFMYRHHPQTIRLAELVREGAIGAPRVVRASFTFPLEDPDDVRLQAADEGGALLDLGCYCVNAARLLAGEPETVAAVQVLGGTPGAGHDGVDVGLAGALRFPGGVLAHFDASFRAVDTSELQVVGESGTLIVPDPWHIREPLILIRPHSGETRSIEPPRANSYALEADDLARAARSVADPRERDAASVRRADAVGQARALGLLLAAAREAG